MVDLYTTKHDILELEKEVEELENDVLKLKAKINLKKMQIHNKLDLLEIKGHSIDE